MRRADTEGAPMAKRESVVDKARKAKEAALALAGLPEKTRNAALRAMAAALRRERSAILEANARDTAAAKRDVEAGRMSKALYKRLVVDERKVEEMAEGVESVAKLGDPVGVVLERMEMDMGLVLERVTCPIGVIGAVFESRPDVVPQVAALCVKSGNAVIMKGGTEARHSNAALAEVLSRAAVSIKGMPDGAIQLIETREEVKAVLELDEYIDLLVPRGSNAFVKYIKDNSRIPVLGHADGICHVYVDRDADVDMAVKIAFDAKVQYPAVCNAAEKLLVHRGIARRFLPAMIAAYGKAGVEVRGDAETRRIAPEVKAAKESDWRTEYLDLIIAVKVVGSLDEAVAHINRYGSHHTDSIVTKNAKTAERFMDGVDSGCVFHNCSTRFSDGYRFGKGAEVGISTNKTHARGPVGLDGLVIYKYKLRGSGQAVAEYSGPNARRYTHRTMKTGS